MSAGSLRIGSLSAGWPPDVGGAEVVASGLARELSRRGHRVAALCLDTASEREAFTARDEERDGLSVRRIAYRYGDHDGLARLVRNDRLAELACAWAREGAFDVVHVHHLTGFGLGTLEALRQCGFPVVLTLHDYWPLCPRGQLWHVDGVACARPEGGTCAACIRETWPHLMPSQGAVPLGPAGEELADDVAAAEARTRYALRLLGAADLLLAPSAGVVDVYRRAGLTARVGVCENGSDVEGLAAEVASLRPARQPHRLGVLGAVQPSKGVLELARAFLRADAPGWVLEVHGPRPAYHGDPSYVHALEALAASEPRVQLRGAYARTELASVLARLSAVAVPSLWEEAYGLSAREALAAGLPVLVSDTAGLAELPGAVRVRAGDEEAWVRALEDLAREPQRARDPFVVRGVPAAAAELEAHLRSVLARG